MIKAETQTTLTRVNDGTDGADGKSAYESAQDGGYEGTESQFNNQLAHASETATNFLKFIPQEGLYVTDNADNIGTVNENSVVIDSDSVDIIKGGQRVAEYSQGLRVWADNGVEIAHLGYGDTVNWAGQTVQAIYTDLGTRIKNEGSFVQDIGAYSVVEGFNNMATGYASHAEGETTTSQGEGSHSEGIDTTAGDPGEIFGDRATKGDHAEGVETGAIGGASHAEGSNAYARDYASHAEGMYTEAIGTASHAEGYWTSTWGDYSHVQGKWNVIDSFSSSYADIVGNGTSENERSNAYALDWNGNGHYKGNVYVGCNADSSGGSPVLPADHFGKTLWTGSWHSGNITVPNTDKYTMFLITMSGQGTVVPAIKYGTYIRGMGGYSSATPTITSYQFAATFSGNTWTFVACNSMQHKPSSNHGAVSNVTVTSIIGLI